MDNIDLDEARTTQEDRYQSEGFPGSPHFSSSFTSRSYTSRSFFGDNELQAMEEVPTEKALSPNEAPCMGIEKMIEEGWKKELSLTLGASFKRFSMVLDAFSQGFNMF